MAFGDGELDTMDGASDGKTKYIWHFMHLLNTHL
jgi:hypothetical protein